MREEVHLLNSVQYRGYIISRWRRETQTDRGAISDFVYRVSHVEAGVEKLDYEVLTESLSRRVIDDMVETQGARYAAQL